MITVALVILALMALGGLVWCSIFAWVLIKWARDSQRGRGR